MFKYGTIICLQKTPLLGDLNNNPNSFLDITSSVWPQQLEFNLQMKNE
jgi:hypothetical protein